MVKVSKDSLLSSLYSVHQKDVKGTIRVSMKRDPLPEGVSFKKSKVKEEIKRAIAEAKSDDTNLYPLTIRAKSSKFSVSTSIPAESQSSFANSLQNILKLIFLKESESKELAKKLKLEKSKSTAANPKSKRSTAKKEKNARNVERRNIRKQLKKESKRRGLALGKKKSEVN